MLSVDKSLDAAFRLCGKVGGKSTFFTLTDEFIRNLKYTIPYVRYRDIAISLYRAARQGIFSAF